MKLAGSFFILAILATVYLASFKGNSSLDRSVLEANVLTQFVSWKSDFNKVYDSVSEEIYRFNVFRTNLQKIVSHNSKKNKTYEMGLNQFSDLIENEFQACHLTLMPQPSSLRTSEPQDAVAVTDLEADAQINWVEKGYVTSIKDEGQCGACWAFAALGPLEAMIKLQGKPLVSLSAQQLMDCSNSYGNYGCNGGFMDGGYQYIRDKGVTTEDKYPYKGVNQKCIIDGGEYRVKGFVDVPDCKAVANSLMSIPIAVAVDASKFYSYKSGVFNTCADKPSLNHAFALVGMTSEYWLGKEQWGVKWGENGYIRISRTGSACGICQMASYPV